MPDKSPDFWAPIFAWLISVKEQGIAALLAGAMAYPPAVLLQQCKQTPFTGNTFGDAVIALQVSQGELDVCASRIDGLIKWLRENTRK